MAEWGVAFTTILITWCGFNPHSGHVVASLNKTLYDNYLCLEASNKQQVQWTRILRNLQEHCITGNSYTQLKIQYLQTQSSYRNEKCVEYLKVGNSRCTVTVSCVYYCLFVRLLQQCNFRRCCSYHQRRIVLRGNCSIPLIKRTTWNGRSHRSRLSY